MMWNRKTASLVGRDLVWAAFPMGIAAVAFSGILYLDPTADGKGGTEQGVSLAVVSALISLAGLALPRYRSADLRAWVRARRAVATRLSALVSTYPFLQPEATLARGQADYVAVELWLLDWYPFMMAVVAASLFLTRPPPTLALIAVDGQLWLLAYVIRAAKQSEQFTIEIERMKEEIELVNELEAEAAATQEDAP